jgi:hypothetical protein
MFWNVVAKSIADFFFFFVVVVKMSQCDFGYERQGLDGSCVPIKAIKNEAPEQCPPGGEYIISNGYRRVAGDTCDADAGVNHLPTVISCPGVFGSVTSNGWTVLIIIFMLAAGLFVLTVVNKDPELLEKVKGWMGETKFKYKPLNMKDGFSSDDDFDLGDDLDAEPQVMHDTSELFFSSKLYECLFFLFNFFC